MALIVDGLIHVSILRVPKPTCSRREGRVNARQTTNGFRLTLDPLTKADLEAGVSQSRLAKLVELSPSTLRGYEKDGLLPTRSRDGKKTYGPDALEALETIKHLRAEGLGLREIAARMKMEPDSSRRPNEDATTSPSASGTTDPVPSGAAGTTAATLSSPEVTTAAVLPGAAGAATHSSAAGTTAAVPSGTAGTTAAVPSGAAGTTAATQTEAELRAQVERLRAQLQAERTKLERLSNQVETRVVRRRNELVLTKKELEELERLRESNIRRALAVTRRTKAIQYASTRPGVIRLGLKKPKK
jgi:DNA-binding transcriptional MerR regulator